MFKITVLSLRKPISYLFFKNVTASICTTTPKLAGHSKWANIKHIKGLKDSQKSMLFSRMARNIRLAVHDGGGSVNPALNTPLKVAIDEALKRDMPNATIQGVLKKCSAQSAKMKRLTLQIRYGHKVFMVVILYSDNLGGSKMLLAPLLKKSGCTYADTIHMFFDKGIIEAVGNEKITTSTLDELEEIATDNAIECGAEEIEIIDWETKHMTFICGSDEINRVKQKLTAFGYNIEGAEHVYIPNVPITLSESELDMYNKFKEKLKNFDGVDTIYDNINVEN